MPDLNAQAPSPLDVEMLDDLQPSPSSPQGTRPIISLAFDLASIPIGSMWKMEMYTPALEQLFAETADIGEEEEDVAVIKAAMDMPIAPASKSGTEARKAEKSASTPRGAGQSKRRKKE